jgi:polyisoprenoid-binding protein YceI
MKMLILPLAFVPVFAAGAELVDYHLKPAQGNRFTLEVTKTGFLSGKKHLLEFGKYEGRVRYDKATPARSEVQFDVQAGDIAVKDTWVSEKDRVKIRDYAVNDMLQSKTSPLIRFVSTAAEAAGDGVKLMGNLTVRGQTRPVVVMVKVKEAGDGFVIFEGESRFRMTIFGLKPPTAALGTIGTKDEMALTFLLRAVRESGTLP